MQQLFCLLISLTQPYMFQATNLPILRSTFQMYIQLLELHTDTAADRCHVAPVGSSVGALYQKLYIQSKSALRMGEFVARNM